MLLEKSESHDEKKAAIARVRNAKDVLDSAAKHIKQVSDFVHSSEFVGEKDVQRGLHHFRTRQ